MATTSDIGKQAGEQTDAQFAQELKQLTSLTEQELQTLLPNTQDAQAFGELLKKVDSAASDTTRDGKSIRWQRTEGLGAAC